MRFRYVGGIGAPYSDRVEFDKTRNILETVCSGGYASGEFFFLCTPDLKLFLRFRVADGSFVGLLRKDLNLNTLPRTEIDLPYASDGEVKADCRLRDIIPDCYYIGFDGAARYDEKSNSLLFGKISRGGAVFRVLDNAYISLGSDGSLSGVVVRL